MKEGLYRISFETEMGAGFGVSYFKNGRLHGGDSWLYYVGTYEVSDRDLKMEVITDRHAPTGPPSPLGVDRANITLSGTIKGDLIKIKGTAREAPEIILTVSLVFLCSL